MSANAAVIDGFQTSAARVARHIPAPHTALIQWWRRRKFRAELAGFIQDLYSLDALDGLGDQDLLRLERAVRLVLVACESADGDFTEFCGKLRIALDGIESGYPPDPRKRPSRAEMLDILSSRLDSAV